MGVISTKKHNKAINVGIFLVSRLLPSEKLEYCFDQDLDIKEEAPVLEIKTIQLDSV
ncbi:MAG: hypothetical protein ACI8RL_001487, partial [Cyclobacteriaceae bacterium]